MDISADITPLLDVVLILLVFFMLTAVTAPMGMAVDLPEAKTVAEHQDIPSVISITSDDKIFFNQDPITLENLKEKLAGLESNAQIIIKGDKEIKYGLFVEIMDVVRETGSHRIVLSAEVKEEKK